MNLTVISIGKYCNRLLDLCYLQFQSVQWVKDGMQCRNLFEPINMFYITHADWPCVHVCSYVRLQEYNFYT